MNIVKRAKKLMKKDKVYLVLGGFHHPPLFCIKEFKELGVEKVAPSHCTGDWSEKLSERNIRKILSSTE